MWALKPYNSVRHIHVSLPIFFLIIITIFLFHTLSVWMICIVKRAGQSTTPFIASFDTEFKIFKPVGKLLNYPFERVLIKIFGHMGKKGKKFWQYCMAYVLIFHRYREKNWPRTILVQTPCMSKHFQNACAPYLHPSICMWKACICGCQDFTEGQTELKPWDSNISEGLGRLVFTALVYVIVGDKKLKWFSAEINPSRVGVYFVFWPLLSDGIAYLFYVAGKASNLHILVSFEIEFTVLLIKIL